MTGSLCYSACIILSLAFLCSAQTTATPGLFPWYIWLAIAVAFCIAVVLIGASIICITIICYKQCNAAQGQNREREDETIQMTKDLVDQMNRSEWELSRKQVKLVNQLAIGEYGPIYDAEVKLSPNMTSRAIVKVFQQGTSQDLVRFREDIEELKALNDPKIGKLLGMLSQPPYYIVLELTVNGDLKTFLLATSRGHSDKLKADITVAQLVAMATDAASGMAYLESLEYVHKDIAARNCLVSQHLGVKITDYKIGRYLFRSEYAVQADGSLMPVRWMAPESVLRNKFTMSSSVWAFGVLLWEIMTHGGFPFAQLSDPDVLMSVCYEGHRLTRPAKCPQQVWSVMERCWQPEPKRRPAPAQLYKTLESSILTNKYKHSENAGDTQLFY